MEPNLNENETLNGNDTTGVGGYGSVQPAGGNGANNNGKAIAALVLGILSIIFAFVYTWIGLIAGIVGIVLGVKARHECPGGMATGGFVCSIVGVVLNALFLACALCALGTLGAMVATMG